MNKSLYSNLLDRFKSQTQGNLILTNLQNSQNMKISIEEIQKIINDNNTSYGKSIKNLDSINDIQMSSEERDRKILDLEEFKKNVEYINNNSNFFTNFKYNFFSKENERLRFLNLQADGKWKNLIKKEDPVNVHIEKMNSYENNKNINRNTLSELGELNNKNRGIEASTGYTNSNWKPLGEFGDITLNKFFEKGSFIISPVYNFFNIYYYEIIGVTSILTSFFIYKKVVSLYSYFTEPLFDLNHAISKEYRDKNIRSFMFYGAPFVVFGIIGLFKIFLNNNNITEQNLSSVTEDLPNSSKNSLFLLLGGLIKRVPSWLRVLMLTFIIIYTIKYYFPGYANNHRISLSYITNLMVFYSYFVVIIFKIGIVINTYFIIKYSLTIYFYIMFFKGKMVIPINLPLTTLNWLNYIRNAHIYENKVFFIEFHIRYILYYIASIYFYVIVINLYS